MWLKAENACIFRENRVMEPVHSKEERMINFQTSPDQYKHWKLNVEGPVATLTMDVSEDVTLGEGYKLKLNSYDLGVDIELADAIQRLRFEHPAGQGRGCHQP